MPLKVQAMKLMLIAPLNAEIVKEQAAKSQLVRNVEAQVYLKAAEDYFKLPANLVAVQEKNIPSLAELAALQVT